MLKIAVRLAATVAALLLSADALAYPFPYPETTSCAYPRGNPAVGDDACAPDACIAVEDARLNGVVDEPQPMPGFCALPCEHDGDCHALGLEAECFEAVATGEKTCVIQCTSPDLACPADMECWGTQWRIAGRDDVLADLDVCFFPQ